MEFKIEVPDQVVEAVKIRNDNISYELVKLAFRGMIQSGCLDVVKDDRKGTDCVEKWIKDTSGEALKAVGEHLLKMGAG